jgi:hypothetical protein
MDNSDSSYQLSDINIKGEKKKGEKEKKFFFFWLLVARLFETIVCTIYELGGCTQKK